MSSGTAVDIVSEKVDLINAKKSPIQDDYIEKYLAKKELDLTATTDGVAAYKDADIVIITAPTNYDSQKNFFDTSAVEAVISIVLESNPNAMMIIKSTIPVGYTESVRKRFGTDRIIFSPEFLRESKALYDNLYPSCIIVGCDDMGSHTLGKELMDFYGFDQEMVFISAIVQRRAKILPSAFQYLGQAFAQAPNPQHFSLFENKVILGCIFIPSYFINCCKN